MISIKDFSFKYKAGSEPAIKNVSLEIADGSFVGVIGNSGAGKTTFTYALGGIVPHYFKGDFYGEIEVNGLDTVTVSPEQIAKYLGMVFQDIDSQMVSSVVEDEILFGLENYGVPKDEIASRLEKVLADLGISDLRERQISTLSGGQKQKVAIASIIALNPDIIVLDEPTGELDPESTKMIYNILKELNETYHKTIIVVEQKIMVLCEYASRIIVMEKGEIVFDDKPEAIGDSADHFKKTGINIPRVMELGCKLKEKGLYGKKAPHTVDDAEVMVKEVLGDA